MKRDFCIGSEWLYYKIYTGVKTADIILLEKLYPVIQELKDEDKIQKWFFIRYKDPEEHLRIRFYSKNAENNSFIIAKLYPVLSTLLQENAIWKVQTDTYQREIERYGEKTIEDSETLFWQDSEMVIKYLVLKSTFVKNEVQLLFSFLAIDCFLNSFSVNNKDKETLMNELQTAFKNEFDVDKVLNKELDKQYRKLQPEIKHFLAKTSNIENSEIVQIIKEKEYEIGNSVKSIKEKVQIPLSSFLNSHIHMIINRQFTSQQRKYELIIYDHLYRYFKYMTKSKTDCFLKT
jgi:thiopeptide-type bacteriocin biosynthesis protein